MKISIQKSNVSYDKKTKSFHVSGKNVKFDSSYILVNEKTGGELKFDFAKSTGSEWDPNTVWIYKSPDNQYTLNVGNDDVTPQHAENYLRAKLRH